MYKARITLTRVGFRIPERLVYGGVKDIVATIVNPVADISAVPRTDKPMFVLVNEDDPKHPDEKVQKLKIYIPNPGHRAGAGKGVYKNGVQLLFQLAASSGFSILGIVFDKGAGANPGEYEFPLVTVNRDDDASELAVIDMCDEQQAYSYGIVMQETSTGNIGIFDPDVENEVPDPI